MRAQWAFVALVLLTLTASPLAFVLLALIAVGVAIAKRIETRRAVVPAAALAGTGVLELALWRIFPDNGRYPFSIADLAAASAFSLLGAALIWQIDRGRALRMVLLVYGFACLVAYVVPSAHGSNITRLQFVAIPIAVLVVSLRFVAAAAGLPCGHRPRRLMEREAARAELLAGAREPLSETRLLEAGDSLSRCALNAVLPRRGGGHGWPLAC